MSWSREDRKLMMRDVVKQMADHGDLSRIDPQQYAATYGIAVADVEAELLRHLSEGEGK